MKTEKGGGFMHDVLRLNHVKTNGSQTVIHVGEGEVVLPTERPMEEGGEYGEQIRRKNIERVNARLADVANNGGTYNPDDDY